MTSNYDRFESSASDHTSPSVSTPFVALDLHEEYSRVIPSTNETAVSIASAEIDFSNFGDIHGNQALGSSQAESASPRDTAASGDSSSAVLPASAPESVPGAVDADSVPLIDDSADGLELQVLTLNLNGSVSPPIVVDESGPRLFTDESSRRSLLTPEFTEQLLQASDDNDEARHILRDVSGEQSSSWLHSDPLELAMSYALASHPEAKQDLQQAALSGYASQSNEDILRVLGNLSRHDPQFAQTLKEAIIEPALSSSVSFTRHQGTDMLLALADQWTESDFNAALVTFQPNQLDSMRKAVTSMPEEVRQVFRNSLLQSTMATRSAHPLLSLGDDPQASAAFDARLQLLAIQPESIGDQFWLRGLPADSESPQLDPGTARLNSLLGMSPTQADLLNPAQLSFPKPHNNAAQTLLEQAFPDMSVQDTLGRVKASSAIDTDYLALVLDSDIGDSGTSATAFDVFSRWGVDGEAQHEPIQEAVERYGADAILTLERRLALYNSLDVEVKEELTGSREQIAPEQLAGVILNGKLGEPGSIGAFLVDEPALEVKLRTMSDTTRSTLADQAFDLKEEGGNEQASLRALQNHTTDGVGVVDLIDHTVDVVVEDGILQPSGAGLFISDLNIRTSGVERFEERQDELIRSFREDREQFVKHSRSVEDLARRQAGLEFSEDVYAYEQLHQTGAPQLRRDYLALAMLNRYGVEQIKGRAPQVWEDLEDGGLTRLKNSGLVKSDQLTEFSNNPALRFDQALSVLTDLQADQGGNLDLSIRRKQALAHIDNDPTLLHTQEIASRFGEEFAVFTTLFEAGQSGTKYEEYVQFVRTTAQNIDEILDETTHEDVVVLRQAVTALGMGADSAQDDETRAELERRHQALSGLLDILDPQSANHQSIRDVLDQAQSRDFNSDTLANWMKENGPVIAAAAVAVALAVVSAGAASPVALVLLSSAAALGATQVAQEALYQINHHLGDTGLGVYGDRSNAGAWVNKHWENFGGLVQSEEWSGTEQDAKELFTSYVSEVATPLTMEYAQNVVMGLVGLGVLRLGQTGFTGLSPQWVRSLVQNPQAASTLEALSSSAANPAAKAFTSQWLNAISKDAGEEIVDEVKGEAIQTFGESALKEIGLGGPVSAALLSLSQTMLDGKADGSDIGDFTGTAQGGTVTLSSSMSADVHKDLTDRGFRVEQTEQGTFKVSSYDSPTSILEIEFSGAPLRERTDSQLVESTIAVGDENVGSSQNGTTSNDALHSLPDAINDDKPSFPANNSDEGNSESPKLAIESGEPAAFRQTAGPSQGTQDYAQLRKKSRLLLKEMRADRERMVDATAPYMGSDGHNVSQGTYTIAPLDSTLATNGLFTCSALVVVDRANNKQYLAHIDSGVSVQAIEKSLQDFDLAKVEIYAMEGAQYSDTLEKIITPIVNNPQALENLRFIRNTRHTFGGLALHNGSLYDVPSHLSTWNKDGSRFAP